MANSAQFRQQLEIFLQQKQSQRVRSNLFNAMPTLEFFFALRGDKKGSEGLGRPQTGVFLPALRSEAKVRKESIFAEREYKVLWEAGDVDVTQVKSITDYDNDPDVANWEDDAPLKRFRQPRFKFAEKSIAISIPHTDVQTARANTGQDGTKRAAAAAIRSVYDAEVKKKNGTLCKKLNQELWASNGEQGYPTDEDATKWDHIHSIASALKADNIYGGVDRSLAANSWWRGNYDTTAHSWSFEQLINYCNYDLGMMAKGQGVRLIVVGGTLMKKAKAEAKQESYALMTNGIPEFAEFGFKTDIVRIHSGERAIYICFDPEVPAGHAACLDPATWTAAIHPDANFSINGPHNQRKIAGGDRRDAGTIDADVLLCCEDPSGNAYFTNLS